MYICAIFPILTTLSLITHPVLSPIFSLSLHDALPISWLIHETGNAAMPGAWMALAGLLSLVATLVLTSRGFEHRSEEHTSELQSRVDLVCRLLLEKKK